MNPLETTAAGEPLNPAEWARCIRELPSLPSAFIAAVEVLSQDQVPASTCIEAIERGRVQVNGQPAKPSREVRCGDIMSRDLVTIGPRATLGEAWALLARHRIKALPVVEDGDRLVGIIAVRDFFVAPGAPGEPPATMRSGRTVGEAMTRAVRSARPEQPLAELIDDFADGGVHHMPVTDAAGRVVGMITQSDVVGALFAGEPTG